MSKIIKNINSNIYQIYLVYVIFGLSVAIFLKDINETFLKISFFETIYFYRGVLFLFSLYLFFITKKKFNINIFFLSILSLIFLYNTLFGETLIFTKDVNILLKQLNIGAQIGDGSKFFFDEKLKTIIINLINIYFPLLVLMFIKFNIDLNWFYKISYKVSEIFIILLSIYITIALIIFLYQPGRPDYSYFGTQSDFPKNFINPHGLLYFLNIFFIQNIIQIYSKINIKKNLIYIIITTIIFIISGSILFCGLCALTFLIYSTFKLKKKYIYFLLILFLFLFLFLIIYVNINDDSKIIEGSLYNSLNIRISYIKLFLFDSDNINYIYGSNIFSEQIYTYPHNSLIDIFICSGFFGVIILFFLLYRLIDFYRVNYKFPLNFIILIFIQLSIFSLLSGFFFKNITLNILLAIMLNLSNLRDEKIK